MKQTFFDYIGAADMERIHSATIAWMISDSCKAFTLDERANLLKALFNVENADIKSIRACNEYEHIDIAFITGNSNNIEDEIWVIENKVKAPLGHKQLSDYNKNIEHYKYPQKHLAVLSLIGILPQDDTGGWTHITYSDLLESINQICNKSEKKNRHYLIIEEYRDCLQNLVNALNEFGVHPENFPEVFTAGSKSKRYKFENNIVSPNSGENEISIKDYISICGLETVLQKYYFVGIINEIIKRKEINYQWCHVSETHGNADFAFHFGDMGSVYYRFDLSFQNGTFKFAVADKNYGKSKFPRKGSKKWGELQKWIAAFEDVQKDYPQYGRLNKPKTKFRVSISYNIDNDNCKWYELSRTEFVEMVIEQIKKALEMAQQAIKYYQAQEQNTILNK